MIRVLAPGSGEAMAIARSSGAACRVLVGADSALASIIVEDRLAALMHVIIGVLAIDIHPRAVAAGMIRASRTIDLAEVIALTVGDVVVVGAALALVAAVLAEELSWVAETAAEAGGVVCAVNGHVGAVPITATRGFTFTCRWCNIIALFNNALYKI